MRPLLHLLVLDMRPEEVLRLAITFALSVGAHVAAALVLWILPAIPILDAPPPPVEIAVIDSSPPEPIVEPPPEPEPEPEPEPVVPPPEPEPVIERRPRPEPRPDPPVRPDPAPQPEPSPEPPAPAEETPLDFSGTTLTNESADSSWQSNVGSGAPMEGPIGRPNAQVTDRNRRGSPDGTPGGTGEGPGTPLVAAGDLSRRPGPPIDRMRELLRANYPRQAQQLGVEGEADVVVQVDPDGTVRVLRIARESYEGFGEACRRTVRQSGRWSPPLDRQGRSVATRTTFRCTFTVRF